MKNELKKFNEKELEMFSDELLNDFQMMEIYAGETGINICPKNFCINLVKGCSDKGVVVDAPVRVSLVGIELL